MKLTKLIFALTLTLVFGAPVARSQAAPTATNSGPDAGQSATRTYRLTYTLTETDGGKRIGTQHFSMIVVNGRKTVLKQGSRIPLATGTSSNSAIMQTQVQYMDIGLNIDASLDASVDVVRLSTRLEQSSVAEEKSGLGTQDPIVRQTTLEGTSILTLGKPLLLGSMDVPGTARSLDVQVVMEPVVQ